MQNSEEKTITDKNSQNEIVELLKKNNELLECLLKMKKKEQRAQTWRTVFHVTVSLLPFIIVVFIVYYLFRLVNENIQAVQSNVETLRDFMMGLIPDFSGVGEKLEGVWQEIRFWN